MNTIDRKNRIKVNGTGSENARKIEVVSAAGASFKVVRVPLTGDERRSLTVDRPLSDIKVRAIVDADEVKQAA